MLKKIGLGIALTATFGLMSCEDSSSSSSGGTVTVSCKVVSENPFTIKSSEAGIGGNITYELKDGKVVETYKFDNSSLADEECKDMKKRSEYTKVTCDGKKIVAYTDDELTEARFKTYTKNLADYCKEMDGKKVDVDGYVDLDEKPKSSNSNAKSSSSTKSATTTSSCDFKLKDDVWEYSYSIPKDAAGISAKGTSRYEFKGKDVTSISIVTNTGAIMKSVCSSAKEGDVNEEYEDGSLKVETTCDGENMTVMTTEVSLDYEQNRATKEELLQSFTAQCRAKL